MASERDEDEGKEPEREEAAVDEADETETDESSEASSASEEDTAAESSSEEPRNRAERRALAKRVKRGQATPGETAGAGDTATAAPRRRPPPGKISGKSSADEVPPWARGFVDWMARKRGVLAGGAAAVLLVSGGALWFTAHREHQQGEAAAAYTEALEVSVAPIRPADGHEPENALPQHAPTFADPAARSRAALVKFHTVSERFPNAPVASLAKLSEAQTLYDLGRYAEAKRLFESVVQGGGDLAGLEGRAYEGLGFAQESLNDLPGALHTFERLASVDEPSYRDIAQFHQARILQRQGQGPRAKQLLDALITRLNRVRTEDPQGSAASNSVLEQSQALLRDIDADDPLGRRPDTDSDTMLRMLEQQMGRRLRGGRPGGAPPADEH